MSEEEEPRQFGCSRFHCLNQYYATSAERSKRGGLCDICYGNALDRQREALRQALGLPPKRWRSIDDI